ncbi:hemolysin III family protein [Flavobacteriaceae bacterium Ap0902]|nr:hemolysin III family protein [Flavobacteriaceae bacterium Ap0902]
MKKDKVLKKDNVLEKNLSWYPDKEEKLNIYTHGLGMILSFIAAILLVIKAMDYNFAPSAGLIIFSLSQICIFSASTLYHAQKTPKRRAFWNIIDHAMIYGSIAGTYSPICLITLQNDGGQLLFYFVWACALIGMILKIRYTGRYNLLSTIIYLAMGWVIVFYWSEISANMDQNGINLLIAGGLAYTIGAILYMIDKIPYNHAIFHLCILIGASTHFGTIYYYT